VREKEKATRVIYVRHGETDYPLDRIYCDGKEDPSLNPKGQEQARQAAEFLSKLDVAAIYASPCCRTQMTAEAIAKFHADCRISSDEALMERNFGVWEGLYFDEIESRYPELYLEWKSNQAAFKPEAGESVFDLADRARPAVDKMIAANAGKTIVIVSHVGPIRALIAQALEMPLARYRQLSIDPASVSWVDYGKTQNNLILLNFHARHWG
jgi:broad specificity phosphatase PhoE